ncbi:MAG TPA: cell division ATP-binding protein FtsE [Firmicutes bacterium]|nr:cell division ATP-binding protein FtsE [Bacillota bacterium]
MITTRNLTKRFSNGVVALQDFSLHIDKGEFVFLVGPSGAGKSSFINLVIRKELPTSGLLKVGNMDVALLKKNEIPYFRRNIGVIFQDFKLLPNKTVYENISFALEVIEADTREIKIRVNYVLDLVGLTHKRNEFPSELSGGEQQRVSLARAIVNRPHLLLADEPTGNLDPETSWGIMELLKEINKRGTTVVMATHNKDIVDRLRRRVVAIENGRIIRDELKGGYSLED